MDHKCKTMVGMSFKGMHAHSEEIDPYAKGMHVVLTGVGAGASSPISGGAGVAVIVDGKVLQFDAGPKTQENLMRAKVLPSHKVDYLFFTHLHVDHTSDFIYMMGWPGFIFNNGYQIYGPSGTIAMTKGASDFLALHYEEFDVYAIKWPQSAPFVADKNLRFPSVTEIKPLGGVVLQTGNITVTATMTPHMMSENGYSFAYRVDSGYGSVVISGDTVPSLDVVKLAKNADLLIHEAIRHDSPHDEERFKFKLGEATKELVKKIKSNDDHTMVHALSIEVGKVAQRAGVKKLVTYHHKGNPHTDMSAGTCGNNVYSQKVRELKNKFITTIRQNYNGEIVIGKPCMSFTVGKP